MCQWSHEIWRICTILLFFPPHPDPKIQFEPFCCRWYKIDYLPWLTKPKHQFTISIINVPISLHTCLGTIHLRSRYIFHDFWSLPPYRRQFFTTIRWQIWQIFDPSLPKKCWRLKWMVPIWYVAMILGTGYSFWDRLRNFLHKFSWIVLSVHKLNKLDKYWKIYGQLLNIMSSNMANLNKKIWRSHDY